MANKMSISTNTGSISFLMKITDGRTAFYQWDTGRQLIVVGLSEGGECHFYAQGMTEPLPCKTYSEDGKIVCDVPDEILQKNGKFKVYAYETDLDGSHTIAEKEFDVTARPKPPNYIYTETEAHTVEEAVAEALEEAKESGDFKGEKGEDGNDGNTPRIGENGNWWIGEIDTGVSAVSSNLPLEEGDSAYSYKQKAPSLRPNRVLSQSSIARGENSVAGCKGYYISEIYYGDTNNKPQVRLSSSQPNILSGLKISSSPLSEISAFVAPKYSEGAYFNITCADHYFYVGCIESVNHDVITFDKYLGDLKSGFQQSANSNVALLTSSSFRIFIPGTDDYTFWVPAEPEIGVVSVSALANTDGSDNIAAAIMSTSIGRENISGGAYSFTFNRGNIAGYCAFAGGFGTMALAKYSGTVGFHTKTTADGQLAGGFYNKINTLALFMIGNGTSEENRSNIFTVLRDGVLIGETKLTEAQLKNLIALPNELETALDSIIAIQQNLIGGTT